MMNGQWFEEIFLYNESSQSSFLKKVLSFKLPNVFLTLALYKALVKNFVVFKNLLLFLLRGFIVRTYP